MPTAQSELPEPLPEKPGKSENEPSQPGPSDQQDHAISCRPTPDATSVLRALTLLESIGSAVSAPERVRAVATTLFDLPERSWTSACHELIAASLLRLDLGIQSDPSSAERTKEHLEHPDARLRLTASSAIVQETVRDMLSEELTLPVLWTHLEPILTSRHDAEALVALGSSFNMYPWGDLQINQQHAIACYHAALHTYTRATTPRLWAMTQNNLGNAQATLAQLTTGAEQAHSLRHAITAFEAAMNVYTRASAPNEWATTQNNLGNALRSLALSAAANGASEDASHQLEEASRHLRAALEVRTPEAMLERWAETENNLANVLLAAADLHDGNDADDGSDQTERQRLLHEATEIYRQVLSACGGSDGSQMPELRTLWAATQNNLGSALAKEAATFSGDAQRTRQRLDEAVTAYRAALDVYTPDATPLDWAMAEYNLGLALHSQADMAADKDNEDTRPQFLTQAVAAFTAALAVYTPEAAPADCAEISLRLALLQQARAVIQAHAHRTDIAHTTLEEAKHYAEAAMVLFHAIGDDARRYAAFSLHEQIKGDLETRGDGA